MTFYIVDVFCKEKYTGNQLAVFLDNGRLTSAEMQKIANEMHYSETTFIVDCNSGEKGYKVRIFTPESEIGFAGHPTLGTAFILNKYIEKIPAKEVRLDLQAGSIPVVSENNILWMRQNQLFFGSCHDKKDMSALLGIRETEISDKLPVQEVSTGLPFTIVPVVGMQALKRARVNTELYLDFCKSARAKGIMLYCNETYEEQQDIAARVFVPYLGIPEDPATGSAAGCLAAYLLKNTNVLHVKNTIGQGYEIGRPSQLYIKASVSNEQYDILVGGQVIEIAHGIMNGEL